MQDRFKFRIWDKDVMHYDDFVVTATGYVGKITEEFKGQCTFNQEDLTADNECVLMQCTGLKDKNDKLIYEGDIVKNFHISSSGQPSSFIGEVKYYQKQGYWGIENNGAWTTFLDTDDVFEVIGNIYEDKGLLNE